MLALTLHSLRFFPRPRYFTYRPASWLMFASTVCGGATTFTQRWWLSLVGVPSAVDLTEFEPDSDQLMNIEMEEHEMWTKTPSRRETLQMTNNRLVAVCRREHRHLTIF